jgi:hypothetical protein
MAPLCGVYKKARGGKCLFLAQRGIVALFTHFKNPSADMMVLLSAFSKDQGPAGR